MKTKIFIDSAAFFALTNANDQYHKFAAEFLNVCLDAKNFCFITSNLVLSETYTLIRYKVDFSVANTFLEKITHSSIEIVYSNVLVEKEAIKFLKKFDDIKLSYTDAVSFQIMKEQNINSAFTFDKHFEVVGYKCLPKIN